jgi:hypothetical protein
MKTNLPLWQTLPILLLFASLACAFNGAAQNQYVTLYAASQNLPLQTNQVVSLVGYDWTYQPTLYGNFPDGRMITLTPFNRFTNGNAIVTSQLPQTIAGLTNILLANSFGWATFQIATPANVNTVSNYVPADAIVIPASATGNVQIILESSADLVNWTAANPGIYGASSATNRFFRVRAVHN